ncbi:MAG TPA: response regulator [Pyrinomonadaceae bacterium]|nr:response regulator [Pyrinomonadaceae bacterium]
MGVEKIRILYAEGYELVLFTARQLLEAEGWVVEVCRDGPAALKKLEGNEHFDLLILDGRLTESGGAELIAHARAEKRLRATPIILFTAGSANGASVSLEADACLSKPGGLKDLVATCRLLLPGPTARQRPESRGERAENGELVTNSFTAPRSD